MIKKIDDYNNVPVKYCSKCLSLKIGILERATVEYCMKCGTSEVHECHIEEWEKKYYDLYKEHYITRNRKMEHKK